MGPASRRRTTHQRPWRRGHPPAFRGASMLGIRAGDKMFDDKDQKADDLFEDLPEDQEQAAKGRHGVVLRSGFWGVETGQEERKRSICSPLTTPPRLAIHSALPGPQASSMRTTSVRHEHSDFRGGPLKSLRSGSQHVPSND